MLSLVLLVLLIGAFTKKKLVYIKPDASFTKQENPEYIRLDRAKIYQNLKAFLSQDLDLKSPIKSFEFAEGKSRIINIVFMNSKFVKGEILFTDTGEVTGIKTDSGLISPRQNPEKTLELLVNAYEFNSNDKSRTLYINKALDEAVSTGEAVFNILSYDGIDEDAFSVLYGETEKQAFCRFLTDKYFETAKFITKHEILLTPKNKPV